MLARNLQYTRAFLKTGNMTNSEEFFRCATHFPQEYMVYCKEKRCGIGDKGPEFAPVETAFQKAVSDLAGRIGKEETEKLLRPGDNRLPPIGSIPVTLASNLTSFHNPVSPKNFLREHIMHMQFGAAASIWK